ncbi:hypothetical protein HYPDE_35543 [Hyphomicrobium denitrificans 1NES1]|uniref:Uncharacterized protein n=1 Tax=Hyphomicrobium denitrificans 1NES1 TaxID=670307 RepID=N0BF82_9HYPH|nr:hypothetical protein HYPDE_35543 [Hyphomicrobium denitrificans 1NES1]
MLGEVTHKIGFPEKTRNPNSRTQFELLPVMTGGDPVLAPHNEHRTAMRSTHCFYHILTILFNALKNINVYRCIFELRDVLPQLDPYPNVHPGCKRISRRIK